MSTCKTYLFKYISHFHILYYYTILALHISNSIYCILSAYLILKLILSPYDYLNGVKCMNELFIISYYTLEVHFII